MTAQMVTRLTLRSFIHKKSKVSHSKIPTLIKPYTKSPKKGKKIWPLPHMSLGNAVDFAVLHSCMYSCIVCGLEARAAQPCPNQIWVPSGTQCLKPWGVVWGGTCIQKKGWFFKERHILTGSCLGCQNSKYQEKGYVFCFCFVLFCFFG